MIVFCIDPVGTFTACTMKVMPNKAITTVTTVGFGDITPKTDVGRLISSFMMLLGWGILAVPTGIVSAEMAAQRQISLLHVTTRTCHECLSSVFTTLLPLGGGQFLAFDMPAGLKAELEDRAGIRIVTVPGGEIAKASGGVHCLTRPVWS